MIKQIGGFEEIVETGKTAVGNVQKSATQGAKNFANATVGQVTGSAPRQSDPGTNEAGNAAAQQQMSDDQAKKFLQDLYGKSDPTPSGDQKSPGVKKQNSPGNTNPQNPLAQAAGLSPKNPNEGKSPEELVKIEALRRQLHGEYYETLTPDNKPPEETVTEKLEREDEEKKMELWEKDKKKPPSLSPTQKTGTGEAVVGVSG